MYAISLDLGTSGFRAYLIELNTRSVEKTVITMGHPIPGCNIMDHLTYAIENGIFSANKIILNAIKKIILEFDINLEEIIRVAVCGNPIQLSLFQGIEIRDLAYAGENTLKRLNISNIDRNSKIIKFNDLFRDILTLRNDCYIIIPPSIKHEIGADALAMMTETDFMTQESPCIVTDYGTNAEMAIKVGNKIITASAAAGPSIEGQGIKYGMLAAPGAISDIKVEDNYWRLIILDKDMNPKKGDLVNPKTGEIIEIGTIKPKGITGTGVISCLALSLKEKLIEKLPNIICENIYLGNDIKISRKDIVEIGKAIGAIRAAHLTLIESIGLKYEDLKYTYVSGATGTYVNCMNGTYVGLIPSYSENIIQFGNTSMALAYKLAIDPTYLTTLDKIATQIKSDHLMMATSDIFKDIYICELSYWEQGMDFQTYDEMMTMLKHIKFPHSNTVKYINKRVNTDLNYSDKSKINIIKNVGSYLEGVLDNCILCFECQKNCPESALEVLKNKTIKINTQKCLGTSCKRCVITCKNNSINYSKLREQS